MKIARGFNVTSDNTELLREAIVASGLSARSFASFLEVDERTVRYWLAEKRTVPGPVCVICRAIMRDPSIVARLAPSN
jgi:DNA-binding transcriptional regulator YiaG